MDRLKLDKATSAARVDLTDGVYELVGVGGEVLLTQVLDGSAYLLERTAFDMQGKLNSGCMAAKIKTYFN